MAEQKNTRKRKALKLAKQVWDFAKKDDMCHDDLVSCCSMIIANVAEKTGEDVDYLLSEVRRRVKGNADLSDRHE